MTVAVKTHTAATTVARHVTRAPKSPHIRWSIRFAIDPHFVGLARFDGSIPCAGRLTLDSVFVRSDRSFSVMQRYGGRDLVAIWIDGTVGPGGNVHGTIRALHGSCDTGKHQFNVRATRMVRRFA